ncbi:hypothetical protein [Gloeobacter kilaueensis]|uniref:Uncharacterized protein n=1 Tax=Gloeobacter kilaueensis (strain ATCC BAA-2537 / CCAP 1431/1 / ULC 316 / JS1) TaxID=1183438 RepID=U5QPP1_GLOK1|nr:hypothetical protein [Gloeobacter kilaueensis]AGY59665.1 hypothetical protein GKIL_3419 [Gloeobacter kilaueensis JS1]
MVRDFSVVILAFALFIGIGIVFATLLYKAMSWDPVITGSMVVVLYVVLASLGRLESRRLH